jgi:hypothetical protein
MSDGINWNVMLPVVGACSGTGGRLVGPVRAAAKAAPGHAAQAHAHATGVGAEAPRTSGASASLLRPAKRMPVSLAHSCGLCARAQRRAARWAW